MHYHHLTLEQRSQIEALQSMGLSQKRIALQLNLSPSTLSRELARHCVEGVGYVGFAAQRQAEATRHQARAWSHSIAPDLINQVEDCIRQDWSPEQISGHLKKMGHSVSHQWIYQYVWADRKSGGTLYTHLRHRGKKYNRRGSKKAGRGCIPNRVDIKERPPIVEEKSRLGDWEIDTIIGAHQQGAILSLVDRKSKFTLLALLPDKTAASVTAGIRQCFERLKQMDPNAAIHSITADNGKEFSEHLSISKELGCGFFFATPYHSWERGLNEHTNGLVRQYFPKKTSFLTLTQSQVQFVEDQLNFRPRKILQYCMPFEVLLNPSLNTKIALHG